MPYKMDTNKQTIETSICLSSVRNLNGEWCAGISNRLFSQSENWSEWHYENKHFNFLSICIQRILHIGIDTMIAIFTWGTNNCFLEFNLCAGAVSKMIEISIYSQTHLAFLRISLHFAISCSPSLFHCVCVKIEYIWISCFFLFYLICILLLFWAKPAISSNKEIVGK